MQRMKQHKLSVSDKEKRKRNMGQQSRGKNFVVCGFAVQAAVCHQQYALYTGGGEARATPIWDVLGF